jgi:hypothetical protein
MLTASLVELALIEINYGTAGRINRNSFFMKELETFCVFYLEAASKTVGNIIPQHYSEQELR